MTKKYMPTSVVDVSLNGCTLYKQFEAISKYLNSWIINVETILALGFSIDTFYKARYLPAAQISLQTNIMMNFSSENTLPSFYQLESETRALVRVTSQNTSGK